ncbi:MAG: PHP domain-containing protein [Candidatus Sungbacteria bacterium]|nr:PHP domain-containing protein [bacterium]MDZ4285880.1 PHP domain-containing protein [Candidatus Sungbacteria bacterium]
MNTIDLQIQTTASDGKHSPAACVHMAQEKQLSVIAITDHDTVGGVDEALRSAGELGVRVISGIEMSAEEHGLHILGYGINHTREELLYALEGFKQGRISGAKQMVENLKRAGFVVEWSDVQQEATGSVFARPHIARAILKRPENKEKLGSIANSHDFIDMYLSNESPHYVHRSHISVKDAIRLIRDSGGVAVWSHPAIHFRNDYDGLEKFLQEMIGWGIQGVEVFNPSHSEDDAEFIQSLASTYRLLRTAGSDFHEQGEHRADSVSGLHSARFIGDYETHGFPTDDIIVRLDEAMRATQIS